MKHLFLVDKTDFVWANNEQQAIKHFTNENERKPDSCEPIPDDRVVYLYQDFFGSFFDLVYPPQTFKPTEENSTYKLVEQKTVQEFFNEWCEDVKDSCTVWSVEDWASTNE